ncbi:GFA family protein [Variovorax paradoxus]|uniref:GFA family protein n=1 Tax=Variovorax paradoxus TaxID=34073 RepID=UPI0029C8543C|nr:GFA family protein [Variovorax paradoxus]WPH18098.1 GFA family protein [Variovorax paradoxus]
MHLEGSCHCGKVRFTVDAAEPIPFMRCYCSICRKTAGAGGYAINLGAATDSMKVTGKRYLGIYQARLQNSSGTGTHISDARRYFCSRCGSALWVWDSRWPELVHPHASAIDTPLTAAPESVHMMLGSKASWVKTEGDARDAHFDEGPSMSLADWHDAHGLRSTSNIRSGKD